MALTPKPKHTFRSALVPLICCALSIVLMTVWALEGQSGPLHRVKQGFSLVLVPLEIASATIGTPIDSATNALNDSAAAPETLSALEQENAELKGQVVMLEEYRLENERLTALLGITEIYNLKTVGARVISHSTDTFDRVLTINKGNADGIVTALPVLNANGLIGQIESVGSSSATVRLITDQNSSVAVFLQSSRYDAILTGSAEGLLYLEYLPSSVNVNVGDNIVTSGAGGVYPKGLVIGQVAQVDTTDSDIYQKVLVEPIREVNSYEEVLVLTREEGN